MFDPEAPLDLERYRQLLRTLDDAALEREGQSCARLCTPEANLGEQPRPVFVRQLQEARAEWRRRHPKP